ncbi:MAG: glucosyltransferase domain-containing protein [Clostridiales bacterium]|jgi:hypothetical protein|nr:glucosyltransferase domain-containing protein [Clostridiales bacterium]
MQKLKEISKIVWNFIYTNGLFISFGIAILLTRAIIGFKYLPFADDWFLYMGDAPIITPEKIAIRPLAALVDVFVLIPLRNHLWIPSLFLTLLLALTAIMLVKILRKNKVYVGGLFLIILTIFPLTIEGTYWLCAAMRIIISLFLVTSSAWFIVKWSQSDKVWWLIPSLICAIASVFFYETFLPVMIIFLMYLVWQTNGKTLAWQRILAYSIPLIATALFLAWYTNHTNSAEISTRGGFIKGDIIGHTIDVLFALRSVFVTVGKNIVWQGFITFMRQGYYVFYIITAIASAALGYFSALYMRQRGKGLRGIIVAIILIGAGLSMPFVLELIRMPTRMVYSAFFGIALLIDVVLGWVLHGKVGRIIYGAIIACTCFICVSATSYQVELYNRASNIDYYVAEQLCQKDKIIDPDTLSFLLVPKGMEYMPDSAEYLESIKLSVENYACVTGAIKHMKNVREINNILTVKVDEEMGLHGVHIGVNSNFYILTPEYKVVDAVLTEHAKGYNVSFTNGNRFGDLMYTIEGYVRLVQ